ncbi:MAG: HD domain-containing protein [Oscillospiraceae bacterium]|nr:HD domain-containing protein [Oscillospiraceae bacterium]
MIPSYVTAVTGRLRANGFDAYLAGGCVRDILMGRTPHDYDVATDALPDRVMSLFADHRTLLQGAAHGTVCVVSEGENIEITTYRSDGVYSDKRRPDTVTFSRTPEEDIARRDLTINAMMMDPDDGRIIDICGGREDLERGIIRSVGDPVERVEEDALRIMRALRFSSVLGFKIDKATSDALHDRKELLREIAVERIAEELTKLLTGKEPERVLCEYYDVLSVPIPEIAPCVGFDQKSRYHAYDVWTHIAKAVQASPPVKRVRLAMMLHDIEKPSYCNEYGGSRHFAGHDEASAVTAEKILTRLRFDKRTIADVTALVRYHELAPARTHAEMHCRLLYGKLGRELFCDLIDVAVADNVSKGAPNTRAGALIPLRDKVLEYVDNGGCTDISGLAINGNDVAALGIRGEDIGKALKYALDRVVSDEIEDRREPLLEAVASLKWR